MGSLLKDGSLIYNWAYGLIMKTLTSTRTMAILVAVTITGMVALNIQQVSAPRSCAGCTEFKKLTHEFEKAVIEAASVGDPTIIPGLLEQYIADVRALDLAPRE
jgi:hypothetical protein